MPVWSELKRRRSCQFVTRARELYSRSFAATSRHLNQPRRAFKTWAASSCDRRRERSRGPTDRSGESGVTSVAWIGKRSSGFTRLTRAWRSGPPLSSVTVISALASGSLSPVYRNSPSIRYSDAETSKTAKGVCSLIIGRLRCRSDGPVRLDDSPLHRVRQRLAGADPPREGTIPKPNDDLDDLGAGGNRRRLGCRGTHRGSRCAASRSR